MKRQKKCIRRVLWISLLIFSALNWSHSAWIYGKAIAAQWLIEHAWSDNLKYGRAHTPWPWADTRPIARLSVKNAAVNEDLFILSGSHGSSLAFGPGHVDGTARPGQNGTIVLSGHRDTHFRFLSKLRIHDTLSLQDASGQWYQYTVISQQVINTDDGPWLVSPDNHQLHLITCYPFEAVIPGGTLRHITIAEKSKAGQVIAEKAYARDVNQNYLVGVKPIKTKSIRNTAKLEQTIDL